MEVIRRVAGLFFQNVAERNGKPEKILFARDPPGRNVEERRGKQHQKYEALIKLV